MNDTTESLTQIYDFKNNDERFLIKNHESLNVNVRYLDEVANDTASVSISGGAAKKTKRTIKRGGTEKEPLFATLADAAHKYKEIDDFIKTCYINTIAACSRSHAVFIIPDDTAMKAIKADIKSALNGVKPDTAEAAKIIQTSKLLYKRFILDSYGSDEKNASYDYRLPEDYPSSFNPDVILRRTSRYGDVYYMKLGDKKCEISLNADMSNSTTCKFIDKFGPKPLTFAFKGNLLALETSIKGGAAKKGKARRALKRMLNSMDSERAAYEFVGNAIASFGAEKCLPYYSSSMLQSAFAIASAFGDETMNLDANISGAHASMLKMYTPKQRRSLNKTNISKLSAYGNSFLEKYEDCSFGKSTSLNSSVYFKQLKSAYKQIANDIKNDSILDNQIAGDIAYGIYDETNNAELALDMIDSTKSALAGNKMSSMMLSSAIEYLDGAAFKGLSAQQFYPMLNLESSVEPMKGGDADDEIDNLEFGDEPEADTD